MTFQVAHGGSRSTEGRLLLPNANSVTIVVRDAASNLVASQVFSLAGKPSVTASFSLEVLKTYTVEAKAWSAGPAETLLYAGSTTVTLTKALSGVLYLLPVDSSGNVVWPIVTPGPAATVPSLSLVSGNSSTFRITFGPDATGFTMTTTPTGLDAYVQTLPNGTPVAGPPGLLSKATLGNDVLVTYYASAGDQSLASLGQFVVPVQSFVLAGPSKILVNDVATATLQSLIPTYTSDSQPSDYSWTATGPVTLQATPGQVKGDGVGHATVTATSKSTGVASQWEIDVNGATVNLTFQVIGYKTLGFADDSLVLLEGETLEVMPGDATLRTDGTSWQWKLDGNLVTGFTGTATFTDLTAGLHSLFVSVDYDGIVYSGSIPITVNPVEAF